MKQAYLHATAVITKNKEDELRRRRKSQYRIPLRVWIWVAIFLMLFYSLYSKENLDSAPKPQGALISSDSLTAETDASGNIIPPDSASLAAEKGSYNTHIQISVGPQTSFAGDTSLIVYAPDAFENVPMNNTASHTIQIENTGDSTLYVENIRSENPAFDVSPKEFAIPPAGSQDVNITLNAATAGEQSGNIEIAFSNPTAAPVQLAVMGNVTAPVEQTPEPDSSLPPPLPVRPLEISLALEKIDFSDAQMNEELSQVLTIRNETGFEQEITKIISTNTNFSVSEQSLKIPPDDSRDVTVFFKPDTFGTHEGMLEIFGTDSSEAPVQLPLNGVVDRTEMTAVVAVGAATTLSKPCGTIRSHPIRGYFGEETSIIIKVDKAYLDEVVKVMTNNPECVGCEAVPRGPGEFEFISYFAGESPGSFRVEFVAYNKDGEIVCLGATPEMFYLGKENPDDQ